MPRARPGVRAPGHEEHDATDAVAVAGEVGRVAHDAVWTGGDELVRNRACIDYRDLEAELLP